MAARRPRPASAGERAGLRDVRAVVLEDARPTFERIAPLPLTRSSSGPDAAAACAASEAAGSDGRPLKVLLAEDHPINRRVVQLILEAAGVDLACVENGEEALEAWAAGDFDLVLMDMQMPVMDGLTAIGEIRERERRLGRPRTEIYALTANAMPDHACASEAAGADGHLTKPITADALFAIVERVGRRAQETPASARRA
jgi:CheY-like chemotaxis protein